MERALGAQAGDLRLQQRQGSCGGIILLKEFVLLGAGMREAQNDGNDGGVFCL